MSSGLIRRFCQLWGLPFTRSKMLVVSLLLIGGTSLFFGCVLDLPYDPRLNIHLAVFLVACLPFVYWPRCYELVANLLIGSSLVTVFLIAMQTGGINSMALMWPTALPVLALLLIGLKETVYWFVTTLLSFVVLHYLTVGHWISGSNAHVLDLHVWGVLTASVLTVLLMVGVQMYDYLHRLQLRKLEASNDELKRTHDTLIRIQNLRDEFVASVGHELRTPMNAILGFNGVLRDQMGRDANMVATVDHIQDATHQLLDLVNDILDFSQLQAGKMQLQLRPCDLEALLAQVCEPWKKAAHAKGIELVLQAPTSFPVHIMLDGVKVKKIVNNLVDNAVKFTDSGSVVLRWGRQDETFRLEVSDTGHGIALDVQGQIFKRFERADLETNRKYAGTGLGLAICDGLVKIHGGKIGVVSHEGVGSTFWVQLPLQDARNGCLSMGDEIEKPSIAADAEFSLLLVDDNKINLMVAEIQLTKVWPRLKVVSCLSAAEALDAVLKARFDVALVDMVMPEMDGIELTHRLRVHVDPAVSQMPILAFTANVELQERDKCLDAGMNDVLTKPMDEKLMVSKISSVLRLHDSGRWS